MKPRNSATWAAIGAVLALASACGGAAEGTRAVSVEPRVAVAPRLRGGPSCARIGSGALPLPVELPSRGGVVALARLGASTVAYVADADARAIHTFDVDRGAALAITHVGGAPAELVVLADGRVAATLRDENRVIILEPGATSADALELRCAAAVATEPVGIAATPDGARVAVASAFGHRLTVLDTASLGVVAATDLARDPRAVLIAEDGRRAFVSHAVGASASVVDLDAPDRPRSIGLRVGRVSALRTGAQGFALASVQVGGAQRLFAPYVSVDPGPPHVATSGYGGSAVSDPPAEIPVASIVDEATERPMTRILAMPTQRRQGECLLPRAAAARGDTLFVTCLGTNVLLGLDARAAEPFTVVRFRIPVAPGPTGLAVDAEGDRALVWSQFKRLLTIVDLKLGAGDRVAPLLQDDAAAMEADATAVARGRELFHGTYDRRISDDGRACASCHPDGRDDGVTWSTPDGARQTPMLAGRLSTTAPYGWMGKHATLADHMAQTMKRLGGIGFDRDGDREDLRALEAYITTLRPPSRSGAAGDPARASLAAAGRALFEGAGQGCTTCHAEGGTDHTQHDVGSDARFDTPSLAFISGTAPYFHDGRYATLMDVLDAHDERMGHTMHLGASEKLALAAYLETL